jgi:predicted HTH domain antitoxin
MLAFVYANYPDMTEESILWSEIKQRRVQLSIVLYLKRKLSLGKAAFVAGMSQEDFLEKAKAKGATVFSE